MTHKRLLKLIAERSGIPESVVRHVLDVQSDVIRACLIRQESVHFPKIMKVFAEVRRVKVPGRDKEEKVVLRIRPMITLRKELNLWTSTG